MRLSNLQALRGVACLLVLAFHASEWELKRCADVAVRLTDPFQHFGYSGVDLFFVLSGFVITWVTFAKLGDRSQFLDFSWRRLWRILPLYWACWVGVILAYTFILRQPFIPTTRWFVGNILILPAQPIHLFIPQAWSLAYELLFYGVFALLFLVPRWAALPVLAGWFAVIVTCALNGIPAPIARGPIGRCAAHLVNPLVLEFLFGCAAAALLRTDRGWRWGQWALVAGIAGFAASGWAQSAGWIDTKLDFLVRAGTFGFSSGLLVFGATACERAAGWSSPRWLQVVGDASYSIYLVHIGVLEVVQYWWGSLPHTLGPHVVYLAALIGGSLAVGFLVHFTIERPILRVLRRRPKAVASPSEPLRRAA